MKKSLTQMEYPFLHVLDDDDGPAGGGVELDTDGNSTCQVAVLQNYHENFAGKALKFSTEGTSSGGIFTNTALKITFDYHPYCASSSKWVVVAGGDDSFPAKWVGIGDAADHPGKKILSGSFIIQKHGEAYKFAFCATIIDNTCFSIGSIDDQNGRRLVLMDDSHAKVPFNFQLTIASFAFLLFALASARFTDPPVPVVDSKGIPLSASEEYYVTQLSSGPTGSGFQPGVERDVKCSLIVMQDYNPAILGEKVKITMRGINSKTIMTGTPLDIAFVNKPSCASSSKWVVVNEKQYSGEWLGIGGATDLGADKKIVDGVFKIEKYLFFEGYKFVFCPSSSNKCFDFARREEKNGKRLILVNETRSPFIFEAEFVKAVKQKSSSVLF